MLIVRKGPTSHLPLHYDDNDNDDNDDDDTIEIPGTEILGGIFTSAPGGVAAPKFLPRDFL